MQPPFNKMEFKIMHFLSPPYPKELKAMKIRRKYSWISFEIKDDSVITIANKGEPGSPHTALLAVLPSSMPRYALYDHPVKTKDGRTTSKLFFITWLPITAGTHHKMLYSTGKVILRSDKLCDGFNDINAGTTKEILSGIGVGGKTSRDEDSESDNDDL